MSSAANAPAPIDAPLSAQQAAFFDTFGFVRIRGLFRDEIERITEGFDEAFSIDEAQRMDPDNAFHASTDPRYADELRLLVPYFIERSDKLSWLRDDPRLVGIATTLLGPEYEYADSDGNLMNCELAWHIDAYRAPIEQHHIKIYFYLDALTAANGALRVIPGTNHYQEPYAQLLYRTLMSDPAKVVDVLGTELADLPSWTVESEPGDVIVGDFRTLHGSFNGGIGRRLFTVNFREPATAAPG